MTRTRYEQIIILTSVKSCEVIIVSLAGSHADRRVYIATTYATRSAHPSPHSACPCVGPCATYFSLKQSFSLALPKPHGLLRSARCPGCCLPPPRVWPCAPRALWLCTRCAACCYGARSVECRLPSWSRLASDGRRRTHRICARHLPRLAPRPFAMPTLQRNWPAAQRRHIHLPRLLHPLARQQRHYLPTSTLCCKKHYGFASRLIIAIILPIPKKTLLIITSAPAGRAAPQ